MAALLFARQRQMVLTRAVSKWRSVVSYQHWIEAEQLVREVDSTREQVRGWVHRSCCCTPTIERGGVLEGRGLATMSTELASLSSVTLELDKVAPFLIKLFEIVSSPASWLETLFALIMAKSKASQFVRDFTMGAIACICI